MCRVGQQGHDALHVPKSEARCSRKLNSWVHRRAIYASMTTTKGNSQAQMLVSISTATVIIVAIAKIITTSCSIPTTSLIRNCRLVLSQMHNHLPFVVVTIDIINENSIIIASIFTATTVAIIIIFIIFIIIIIIIIIGFMLGGILALVIRFIFNAASVSVRITNIIAAVILFDIIRAAVIIIDAPPGPTKVERNLCNLGHPSLKHRSLKTKARHRLSPDSHQFPSSSKLPDLTGSCSNAVTGSLPGFHASAASAMQTPQLRKNSAA